MKLALTFQNWLRYLSGAFLMVILMVSVIDHPIHAQSEALSGLSTNALYYTALRYEYERHDYVDAYVYMFAYVQQNPPDYANNVEIKKFVDGKIEDYKAETGLIINEYKSCKQQTGGAGSKQLEVTLPPPPDGVLVCTKSQYQGTCGLLFVGDYRTYQSLRVPNDSITSVMVGSRVKITFYTDSLGNPPMITFTTNDSDLSNNLTYDGYRWSRAISTAKVEWK